MTEPVNRISRLQDQLVRIFPQLPEELLYSTIIVEWRAFVTAPVQTFVPILVERRVREAVRVGRLPVAS